MTQNLEEMDTPDMAPTLAGHYLLLGLGVGWAALAAALYALTAPFWAGLLTAPALLSFCYSHLEAQEYDDALDALRRAEADAKSARALENARALPDSGFAPWQLARLPEGLSDEQERRQHES